MYRRTVPRPRLRATDRLLWVGLAKVWTGWRQGLVIVSPTTVLRWQRRRFCDYWTNLSASRPGVARPSTPRSKLWSSAWPPRTLSGAPRERLRWVGDLGGLRIVAVPRPSSDPSRPSRSGRLRPGRCRDPSPTSVSVSENLGACRRKDARPKKWDAEIGNRPGRAASGNAMGEIRPASGTLERSNRRFHHFSDTLLDGP